VLINNSILKSYLVSKKLANINDSVEFQEIGRGAFNINYLVKTSRGKKFIFRFILWSMRDNIKNMAKYEALALKNIEKLNIGPGLILIDGARKKFPYPLIIENFVPGKTMKQNNKKYIDQIMAALPIAVKLHKKGRTKGLAAQSKIISNELFKNRLEYFKKYNSPYAELFKKHLDSINDFLKLCNRALDEKAFIHGDFNPENFIISDNGKWHLVDWQGSFVGDPAFDIATLLWDFYWNFFIGKSLSLKQKNLIKKKYCKLSKADIQALEKKIGLITTFLDLDMLVRIEYLHTKITKNYNLLKIESEEKKFIAQKRILPARKLLVNKKILSDILGDIEKIVKKL
jgi:thiamine kinase-like enzyme